MKKQDKHGWLRAALADAGYRQKDLAKAWGVDDAVVSRFIQTGEPEAGLERLQILGRMLGLDLNELSLRLTEGLAPRRLSAPPPPTIRVAHVDEHAGNGQRDPIAAVLDDIEAQAKRLRRLVPAWNIAIQLSLKNEA